ATIDKLHCFCECAESPRFQHKTLLTCFTDNHAAGCGICMKEALLAGELKEKGAPDTEIVSMVESMFRTDGHPPTHHSK
ncbi:MAG TPA: PCYCGC motif-containing (lipo)protein, partial [Blastocatellia bacterium]